MLDSGAALGFGVGPLVVSINHQPSTINHQLKVAIPGKNTTANFLFSLAFPKMKNKKEVLFSEIEDAVLKGKFDLGVIIHESRFTYQQKGLKKVIDLGEWWAKQFKSQKSKVKNEYKLPIPLGGIFIKKYFPKEIQKKVNRVIRRSVEFAFANPDSSSAFVKKHSQEMDDEIIKQHINLYVNKFSISLGRKGKKAIAVFLKQVINKKSLNNIVPK